MQKTIITFVLVLWTVLCQAQQRLTTHGPKGNIKTLIETRSWEETLHGNRIVSVARQTSIYDKEGRVKDIQSCAYTIGDKPGAGLQTKIEHIFPDTFNSREVYVYNENGLPASVASYIGLNRPEPSKITEYTYDDYNRLGAELIYYPYQEAAERILYKMTYDATGHISEKVKLTAGLNEEFREAGREKYSYDVSGNLIEKFDFDYETKSYWRDYSAAYDASGRLMESKNYLPDGNVWARNTNIYDSDGKCIESVSFDSEDNSRRVIYSYEQLDRQGNFLKETIAVPGEAPHQVIEWTIEYY